MTRQQFLIRQTALGIAMLGLGMLAMATAFRAPHYTPAQLADPSLVKAEILRYEPVRDALAAKVKNASQLQAMTLQRDLAQVEALLEALHYIEAHGYNPKDPGLNKLAYFRGAADLSEALAGRAPNSPAGEAPSSQGTGASREKPRTPPEISFGETIRIEDFLIPKYTVIVDFSSPFCPPCRAISPRLERLHATRDDIAVVKVNINRPSAKGIDWQSPVARQFELHSVPSFRIYSPDGTLEAEGQEAYTRVAKLLQEAGISE